MYAQSLLMESWWKASPRGKKGHLNISLEFLPLILVELARQIRNINNLVVVLSNRQCSAIEAANIPTEGQGIK